MNLIAKRGVTTKNVPYNTKDAFILGLTTPYLKGISVSVRMTSDEKVIAFQECETPFGLVREQTADFMKHINIGTRIHKQRPILLEELLNSMNTDKILLIEVMDEEMRNPIFAQKIRAILEVYQNLNLYVFSTSREIILLLKSELPNVKFGLNYLTANDIDCAIFVDFWVIPYSKYDSTFVKAKLADNFLIIIDDINNFDQLNFMKQEVGRNFDDIMLLSSATSLLSSLE